LHFCKGLAIVSPAMAFPFSALIFRSLKFRLTSRSAFGNIRIDLFFYPFFGHLLELALKNSGWPLFYLYCSFYREYRCLSAE